MKYLVIIVIVFSAGCSAAIRNRGYVAASGFGWKFENSRATYECAGSTLSVGGISESTLIVAGPGIPLIPFMHEYPGYLTVTISNYSVCPVVIIENSEFNAYEYKEFNQEITCQYKLGTLGKYNELSLNFQIDSSCKAYPLKFKQENSWKYCLVCSA